MKEWKIGEIFEYKGEWYQCVKSPDGSCKHCDMNFGGKCPIPTKECMAILRSDLSYIIFKKLEKVGVPYEKRVSDGTFSTFQRYKVYNSVILPKKPYMYYNFIDSTIEIEIKQNKEDMEEKKIKLSHDDIDWLKKQIRWAALPGYITHEEDYDRATEEIMNLFIPSDTEHSSSEKIGKNLKPFDLEAAKAGKPVCTRDGRKARIVCFDRKDVRPIIALVESYNGDGEGVYYYYADGLNLDNCPRAFDLMMLPKKKEGWINIYKATKNARIVGNLYPTKEEAVSKIDADEGDSYLKTIKIEWEE